MVPKQVLQKQVRMDLGVMALKGYSTFLKLQVWSLTIRQLSVRSRTLMGAGGLPLSRDVVAVSYSSPPSADWAYKKFYTCNTYEQVFFIKGFRTIVFIFIVISTTFRPICPPAFFRCLLNMGTFMELWTTSFIESTGMCVSVLIPLAITFLSSTKTWRRSEDISPETWK